MGKRTTPVTTYEASFSLSRRRVEVMRSVNGRRTDVIWAHEDDCDCVELFGRPMHYTLATLIAEAANAAAEAAGA